MLPMQFGTVGKEMVFEGYATDYDRAITAVQFSIDGGVSWTTYETPRATSDKLVHWRFAYTPKAPGEFRLLVRSVNDRGQASPTPDGVSFFVEEEDASAE